MQKDLEQRTKRFALDVIQLAESLPRRISADILACQLLRSATSMGANYRKANRGLSRADFVNKIGTAQREAAEAQYWLAILIESGPGKSASAAVDLLPEATERLAIFTRIGKKLEKP